MSDTKPTFNNFTDNNSNKCSICFDIIGDKNIFITNCNHTFCGTCMIKHSRVSNLCPLCRTELIETQEDILPESSNQIGDTSIFGGVGEASGGLRSERTGLTLDKGE